MALEQHIETLKKRHAELDTKIRAETARPLPDDLLLHHLKAEKLVVKDSISQLMGGYQVAA